MITIFAALLVPAAIALADKRTADKRTFGGRIALTAAYYIDKGETQAHYAGKVTSRKAACERGRTIKIYGAPIEGKYRKIGKAKTDRKGKWRADLRAGPKPKIVAINLRVPVKKLSANRACTKLSTF